MLLKMVGAPGKGGRSGLITSPKIDLKDCTRLVANEIVLMIIWLGPHKKRKYKTILYYTKHRFLLSAYLPMFIENVAIETICVGEALGPSAFSHADNSVLFRVKNSPL